MNYNMQPGATLKARSSAGLFGLIWLAIVGVMIYAMLRGKSFADRDFVAVVVSLIIFSLFAFRKSARRFACIAIITILAPLYMFEIYLRVKAPGESKAAYVLDLRERGVNAYPAVFPRHFVDLWRGGGGSPVAVEGREVLPLAGIPDAPTVYCRAYDGNMVVYDSDSLGFRNSTDILEAASVDFVLLGDSYVHGFCVPDEYTYAAHLSKLGSTINLGMTGTSLLAQLAIYKEYAEHLAPNHILWFFYEGNDLYEFFKERSFPPLEYYLDLAHSQQLTENKDKITLSIKKYVNDILETGSIPRLNPIVEKSRFDRLRDFMLLSNTRFALLSGKRQKTGALAHFELPNLSEQDWKDLDRIWRAVVDLQNKAGGKLTFIYVPGPLRFATDDASQFIAMERKVIDHWSRLGADYLSLSRVITIADDPLSLYYRRHFTKEAYKLTSDHIINHLRSRTEAWLSGAVVGDDAD